MTTLKLRRDAYGPYARHSAIADFLEVAALRGRHVHEVDVARSLEQDNIYVLPSAFDRPVPGEDDFDRYRHSARRIFDLLSERERTLRGLYPLIIADHTLRSRRGRHQGIYKALLAMSVLHAYDIDPAPHDPRTSFERVVARCLRRNGFRAATTGTAGSAGLGFSERLTRACSEVGLVANAAGAIISKYAKDENVDTLAHFDFHDDRPGRWTAIGQCTVASSDQWDKKICEPSPSTWRSLIAEAIHPTAFLAVPHHVERAYWNKLLEDRERLIFDRLRLTASGERPLPEERGLVAAVLACEVEW